RRRRRGQHRLCNRPSLRAKCSASLRPFRFPDTETARAYGEIFRESRQQDDFSGALHYRPAGVCCITGWRIRQNAVASLFYLQRRRRGTLVRRNYHTRLSLWPKSAAFGEVGRSQRLGFADRCDNRWRDRLANTRASERKRMTEAPSTSRGSRSTQRTVVVASSASAELVDA